MKIKIRCIIRKKNYIYDISYTKIKKREKKQFTQKYEENIKKLKFRFRIILPDITRVTRAVYFFDYIYIYIRVYYIYIYHIYIRLG